MVTYSFVLSAEAEEERARIDDDDDDNDDTLWSHRKLTTVDVGNDAEDEWR